jgi:hypothetical protein
VAEQLKRILRILARHHQHIRDRLGDSPQGEELSARIKLFCWYWPSHPIGGMLSPVHHSDFEACVTEWDKFMELSILSKMFNAESKASMLKKTSEKVTQYIQALIVCDTLSNQPT